MNVSEFFKPANLIRTAIKVLIVVGMFLVPMLLPSESEEDEEETDTEEEPTVAKLAETVLLNRTDFRETLDLVGETEPIRQAYVASELPGRVVDFTLEENAPVEAGALVMRVGTSTIAAEIAPLQAQIEQIEVDIAREERLLQRGLGLTATVETLEAQRAVLEQSINRVYANMQPARTTAPISGMVVETMIETGEMVGAGSPVARILDTTTLVVRVGLPEREIRHVEEGMDVQVRIEATGEEFVGRLAVIGIEANTLNRTFPLEIHIDNVDGRLRAGMRATAVLPKDERSDVIVVPRDAVMRGLEGPEVFIVDENDQAVLQPVTLGPGRGGFVIVETGLDTDDQLVVRGHRNLIPGETVDVVRIDPCCDAQFRSFLGLDDDAESNGAVLPTPTEAPEAPREPSTETPD